MQVAEIRQELKRLRLGLRSSPLDPALPLVGGLAIVGLLLRIYGLGRRSIWLDEAFSVAISQRHPLETVRLVQLTDAHPPLYYLLLNLWLSLDAGDEHVRLLSALIGVASIVVMYFLGRAVFGARRAGVVAAAILAFSPFHIWYAQEARMYALLVFLVLTAATLFVRALQTNSAIVWAGFSLAAALAAYADYGALWFVGSLALFYLVARKRFPGTLRGWALSHAALAILYAPWLPSFFAQTSQVAASFWLPPPSFQSVFGTFLDFHSQNFPLLEISAAYIVAVLLLTYIVPEEGGWQRMFSSFLLFMPLLVSAAISLRRPIFLSRNLIPASVGYYLLVTGVVQRFKGTRAAIVLLAPLLVANLFSIGGNLAMQDEEDWRSATAYLERWTDEFARGVVVFVPSYAELPFRYHYRPSGEPIETRGYPSDEILLHPEPRSMEDVAAGLRGNLHVWLVLRDVEVVDPDWEVKGWLDTNGYVRLEDRQFGDIQVITYFHWSQVYPVSPSTPNMLRLVEQCRDWQGVMNQACRAAVLGYEPYDPNVRYHRVNPGETLSWLALRYGSTVEAIMRANDLEGANRIYVGEELVIPLVDADED